MNATLHKFGYPGTLLHEYRHWCVLLRPAQVTLGALVLAAKSEATSFAALPPEAFAELHGAITGIETALRAFKPFDRINYLMLMMVDPHVHFHVIPRYATAQAFADTAFTDAGWPGPPDLKTATAMTDEARALLLQALQSHWPQV